MKAFNVRPGTKLRTDNDPRGYVKVTARDNQGSQLQLTFDTGEVETFLPTEDVLTYESPVGQAHPNANAVLAAVYRELRDLLDGDVDAPNVWRWTAMRLVKRAAEVLPVDALRKPVPDPFEANPFRNVGTTTADEERRVQNYVALINSARELGPKGSSTSDEPA